MLDDYTRASLRHAEVIALRDGRDLFETMESAGLLMTKDREREISIQAIHSLLAQLDQQQSFILAGLGGGQTITGAVRGFFRFCELYAETLAK